MTDGKIINLFLVSRGGPVKIAVKVLTAEAAWQDAEPPDAGAKTAVGTDPASNAATSFGNENHTALKEPDRRFKT
jgi:hypothetical protein